MYDLMPHIECIILSMIRHHPASVEKFLFHHTGAFLPESHWCAVRGWEEAFARQGLRGNI